MTSPTGFEDFHKLGRTAAELTQVFTVEQDRSATYEGHDSTETVHVTLDADGLLTDVTVERAWQDKLDSRRFGDAVLEAIEAAGRERLTGWANTVAEAGDAADFSEEPPPRRRRPAAEPEPQPAPEPFEINPSRAMMDQLMNLLHRVGTEMSADAGPRAVTGDSDGGHVTVTLSGKQVMDIDMEFRWVGLANNMEVASELRSAFRAAYAAADRERAPESGAVAELRALTADPNTFVAELFGIRR